MQTLAQEEKKASVTKLISGKLFSKARVDIKLDTDIKQ